MNRKQNRGSVEVLIAIGLLVVGMGICAGKELSARRKITQFASVGTDLTALYVGEFVLVHVIATKKATGVDVCPNPAAACEIDFSPNARLWRTLPGQLWNLAQIIWMDSSSTARAADNREISRDNSGNAGATGGTGGTGTTTPPSADSGNFPAARRAKVKIRTTAPAADGRYVCSVYTPANGQERQLCMKEAPKPELTLLLNGSTGPITNVAPNSPLTLTYTARYAETCKLSVNQPVQPALNDDTVSATSGSFTYSLPQALTAYTFQLRCDSAAGSTVVQATATTTNFTPRLTLKINGGPGPVSAEAGSSLAVTWTTQYCSAGMIALSSNPGVIFSAAASGTNSMTLAVPPNQKVTITLACQNEVGRFETSEDVFTYRKIPIYRAYNPIADCHLYTANESEYRNVTTNAGYLPEGIRFYAYDAKWKDSIFPIRRFYNSTKGCHYYTMNGGEADTLLATPNVWREETQLAWGGLSLEPQIPGSEQIFHLYNTQSGGHIFTANAIEKDAILRAFGGIWVQHNSLGYAIASELPPDALPKTVPVFRAYLNGYHLYTQNCAEYQAVVRGGWSPEGIQFFLWEDPLSGAAVKAKRFRTASNGSHLYTRELASTDGSGWIEETGIGFVTPYRSPSMAEVYHFKHRNGNHFYTTNRAEIIDPATNAPRSTDWTVAQSLGWTPANGDRVECPVTPQPPAPVSVSLLVDGTTAPPQKKKGDSYLVTWSSQNATSCQVSFGGRVLSTDVNNSIGGIVVGPVASTGELTLNCTGSGGSDTKRATLNVRDPIAVYLNSPRCTDGRAPFESDTPQDFTSCTVSFNDDCAIQKDGAQWGYTSRGPGDQANIDAMSKQMILEARLGTCRGTSCAAQGGWDKGTYACDGKARIARYR